MERVTDELSERRSPQAFDANGWIGPMWECAPDAMVVSDASGLGTATGQGELGGIPTRSRAGHEYGPQEFQMKTAGPGSISEPAPTRP